MNICFPKQSIWNYHHHKRLKEPIWLDLSMNVIKNKTQDGFNDTNHISQGIRTNGGNLFSWIKWGISPLSCQLPFLPPGGKGLKFISIKGPSWCLITSGLIPEPNGGKKQTNHNSSHWNFPRLSGNLSQPARRANQPSSNRRDVKKREKKVWHKNVKRERP